MPQDQKSSVITAYDASKHMQAQSQDLPGKDEMEPLAEHLKQEVWDAKGQPFLREYVGSGKLAGKKALITGGDSGIGRSVALFFAKEGADVSIVYLPEEESDAQWVQKTIQGFSRAANLIKTDLEDDNAAEAVIQAHMNKFHQLDILVNNASKQIFCKSIKDIDMKQVKSTFQSNIFQMFDLTKHAIPHMKRGGSIINTTSVTAYRGSPSLLDYSSTKGAIVSFTRSLAVQLAPAGIRVNAIAPGPVYTPLQPASRPAEMMEGWEIGKIPLYGRAAQPAELAEPFVLLAGPGGNFMTGSVLHVNGGQHIGGS